jgi:pilus assembly protein Flp/PilA
VQPEPSQAACAGWADSSDACRRLTIPRFEVAFECGWVQPRAVAFNTSNRQRQTDREVGTQSQGAQFLSSPAEIATPLEDGYDVGHQTRLILGGLQMRTIVRAVSRFIVSEDGPTAVEYAVMLALIVIVCLTAITSVGTNTNAVFGSAGTALSTAS